MNRSTGFGFIAPLLVLMVVAFNAPIAYGNVMLICNRCDKPTRISRVAQPDGSMPIVCKQCGEMYLRNET